MRPPFSINADELVNFIHQNNNDITLNRVTGDTVSQIKGALTANGNIFLINPNGILFGAGAAVDVAGLLATTFDIANQDFMDGKFNFSGELMNGASITNRGKIEVGDEGFVYLIAPNVENTGHIIANVGRVALASDGSYNIDLTGNGLVTFSVTDADLSGAEGSISNGTDGKIEAGHVLLSGSEKDAVMSSVVNSGEITAATELTMAGDDLEQSGTINAASTTLAADNAIVSNGGSIQGETAKLSAGTGIGADSAVQTEVNSLDISSEIGAIRVDEADELDSLMIAAGDSADVAFTQLGTDPDTNEPMQEDISVQFDGQTLSASLDTVKTDLDFTHSDGGMTLSDVNVEGDLSVTAAGNILGDDSLNTAASGERIDLATTVEGASIGAENNALRIDAGTLSASTEDGHIVVSDTSGDLALDQVTTGDTSATGGLRAIITAEDGDLTGVSRGDSNVNAWTANLKADGAIGSQDQAVTTSVEVLSASTQDGSIHVANTGDDLVLNTISAGERITQDGKTVSTTAVSNADGEITLSNGALGSHDVSIRSDQDILITNSVTATRDLSLESREGSLYQAGASALLTGRDLDLSAGGTIGQSDVGALKTQSNEVNARAADGGVYLQEGVGLTVGKISAAGDANDVELSVTQGDINLNRIQATGGSVLLTTTEGAIKGDGSSSIVEADSLTLDAKKNIGTSGTYLFTKVDNLTTTSGTNLAGTYVSNQGPLVRLDVTTLDGNVSIRNTSTGGALTFTGNSDELGLNGTVQTGGLDFSNDAGGLNVNGMDLSGQDVTFTATGAIDGQNGVLKASRVNLSAEDGIDMATHVDELDASTRHGNIDIDNATHTGTLAATAEAGDGNVTLKQGGDLSVGGISASGDVSLTAGGSITGTNAGTDVEAANLTVSGNGIGSSGDAFATAVDGSLSADAGTGALLLANVGSLTLLDGQATGDIDLTVTGDAILDTLTSGGEVVFSAGGRVSDGNGDQSNIEAGKLTMDAQQIGARDGSVDALEMKVDELVLDTSNGGIFVRNLKGTEDTPLTLTHAEAAGGAVSIATDGDMDLNSVTAAGNKVTLTSGGAINDSRPEGTADANVLAKDLDMRAQNGVGNTGALSLDVDRLSVGGGAGNVNAANLGAVAVDSDSLEGKGDAGVTIIATSITILDDNGGIITLGGGSLTLTATNGNVVFLNQDDTIVLPGGGSITLTAKADPELQGYNGNIIAANLTTEGGDITLDAEANVTLGMLETGGTGDVSVTAHNGVILDGNGADENVRGDHVTLTANTPSLNDAEINRETAIADYAARLAELNANTLQLENLQQQLKSHIAALKAASVAKGIAQVQENSTQSEFNRLQAQVNDAQAVVNALNTTLNAATVVRNAVAIGVGAAQAVPFSGDAGADAAFAVLDLALSAAQTALDSYERYDFDPLKGSLTDKQIDLATLKANTRNAITSVETYTNLRDTTQVSVDNTTQAVFNAQVASDASEVLRKQALSAYVQNQDIDMSADNPLGIQANRLDMGTTSGRALNSGVYLNSTGNLGLGNIEADGEIRVADVVGDIGVVGNVISPSLISLDAGGAVFGVGGTWVNGTWIPEGMLKAPAVAVRAEQGVAGSKIPLYTETDEIAIDAGAGDAFVINNNGGDELILGTVDGLSGLTAEGDMGLLNQGDLRLKTQIVDTEMDTDSKTHLIAQGGAIIDDNGEARNVTAGDLFFRADGQVELDTLASRVVDGTTSAGDILLREGDDLTLVDLETGNGDIDVDAGGDLTLQDLAAGGDSAAIRLDADGRIDDDQDNETDITGKRLELTAGGSIGATGTNEERGLDTAVDVVTANAKGDINLHDQDDLDVEKVTTTSGDVTLSSDGGNLSLGEVSTNGDDANITLVADGAIDALNEADDTPELNADQLALRAGAGIGSAGQSLLIETGALEADAGLGGLYLRNQNRDLTVGGVTPNLGQPSLSGLDASGDLHLTAADGAIVYNEDVTQTGEGDMRLDSHGDQTLNANLDAAGDLTMDAGGALTVNGKALSSGGNLDVDTGAGITTLADTEMRAGGFVDLNAGGPISLTSTTVTSGAFLPPFLPIAPLGVSAQPDNVDLSITSASGDILATDNTQLSAAGALSVTASDGNIAVTDSRLISGASLQANAGQGINLTSTTLTSGATDIRPLTAVLPPVLAPELPPLLTPESNADLSLNAGSGDIALSQGSTADAGGALTLRSEEGSVNFTNSSRATAVTDATLEAGDAVRLAEGSRVEATNGDLKVTAIEGAFLAQQSSALRAGGDLIGSAGTDLAFTTGVTADADGDVDLGAGDNLTVEDATVRADGDAALSATDGNLAVTRSTVTAGGSLSGDAGQGINLTSTTLTSGATDIRPLTAVLPPVLAPELPPELPPESNADLSLNAGSGDIALSQSSTADAGGALTLRSEEGSVNFTNSSRAAAVTDATLEAGDAVRLAEGSRVEATNGDLKVTAIEGAFLAQQSSALRAGGDLIGSAGTDLAFTTGVTADADGDVDLGAGDNLTVEDATVRADGDAALSATDGNLAVTRSTVTAGGSLSGDAGASINLTEATATAGTSLTMNAGTDIKTDNSEVTAESDKLDLQAVGNIALTDSQLSSGRSLDANALGDIEIEGSRLNAGRSEPFISIMAVEAQVADLTLNAEQGGITLDNSDVVASHNVSLDAGQNILLTDTGDDIDLRMPGLIGGDTGSTLRAEAGDLKLKADGDITAHAGSMMSSAGLMKLNAGESVSLTATTMTTGESWFPPILPLMLVDEPAQAGSADLAITSANGNILLDDTTRLTADGDLTITAADGDLTVEDATVLADGDAALSATNGNLAVTRSNVTAGGALSGDAGQGINLAAATLTSGETDIRLMTSLLASKGNVDLTLNAGSGDIALSQGSTVDAGGALTLGSEEGNVSLTNSSRATAVTDATLEAGAGVSLAEGSRLEATSGKLGVTAGGVLTMDATSDMRASDELNLNAKSDMALSTLRAGGDVTAISEEGGIQADQAIEEHIHGDNLFLSAAKSIGSTLSGLKTRVENLYATITGTGDLHLQDMGALTVKSSTLADGDARLDAGGDLTIEALAVNGDAVLDSDGSLTTGADGHLSAHDLQGSAVKGIQLNAELDSATMAVTGTGAIDLDNQGDLRLDGATTADGDIDVNTAGDLGIGRVTADDRDVALASTGAIRTDGAGEIEGINVTLRAGEGIGGEPHSTDLDDLLTLRAKRIDALSDAGDVILRQQGPVFIRQARTGDGRVGVLVEGGDATLGDISAQGDVALMAQDGALLDDNDAATQVTGAQVELTGHSGVGTDTTAIATAAERLELAAENGGINVVEQDGLAGLNASATDGDIRVRTLAGDLTVNEVKTLTPGNAVMLSAVAGAIQDGNAEANNIVASLLELTTAKGIARASDPLDVDVSNLSAEGGRGGVYINNRGDGPLTVSQLTGGGNVDLKTAGDLDLSTTIRGSGVSLRAIGDVVQGGDIVSLSDVYVGGLGDVTMMPGVKTDAVTNVYYGARGTLKVNEITTTEGLNGGRIVLEGNAIKSNAANSGSLSGGEIRFILPSSAQGPDVEELVDNVGSKSRVSVNGRTLGGKVTDDSQYVNDLISLPQPVEYSLDLSTPSSLGFQQATGNSDQWVFNR